MEDKNNPSEEQLKALADIFEKFGGLEEFSKKVENFDLQKFQRQLLGKERFDNYAELLNYSVREKWRTLPTISALAATLLIVATFNKELLPITPLVKSLISVLLLIIPLGLWGLYSDLTTSTKSSLKNIENIVKDVFEKDISEHIKKAKKFNWIGFIPFLANVVLTLVVVVIILLIWKII